MDVNDSETGCYYQNTSYDYMPTNIYVWGDITPFITNPYAHDEVGGANFTQEQSISFLGYTNDDCGDPLTLNVTPSTEEIKFYANHTAESFNCTSGISLIGANAYSCVLPTSLSTQIGWYNASFYLNKSYYYSNWTFKTSTPSLFYLHPLYKLESAGVVLVFTDGDTAAGISR